MKKLFISIRRIFYKRYEYVYFFEVPTIIIDEKQKRTQEQLRANAVNAIAEDLKLMEKTIEHVDMWQDIKEYITSYTVCSANPQKQSRILPLFYELYAYRKLKKLENFTYPVVERLFKISDKEKIKVLKFKVEV